MTSFTRNWLGPILAIIVTVVLFLVSTRWSQPAARPEPASADASAGAAVSAAPPEREDSAELRRQADLTRQKAFAQIQPDIRRFIRKKSAFERAEKIYLERLDLWILTIAALELRSTPGTFAGDVPEHDTFAFSDFQEAAESLLGEVTANLNQYTREGDSEYPTLVTWKQQSEAVLKMPSPSSGSRLADALQAMDTAEFARVKQEDDPRVVKLGLAGGGQIIGTLERATEFLQNYMNSRGGSRPSH